MGEYVIKLPDVGEGVAEAELVEWMVKEGANVREDEVLAAVMTDKATVEIPSPVEGKIKWLGGKPGDVLAVGSPHDVLHNPLLQEAYRFPERHHEPHHNHPGAAA